MRRKKSLVWRILPWVILAGVIAALVVFVFIPLYSQKVVSFSETPVVVSSPEAGGKIALENDSLLFEMDQETTHFSVTDKQTGKIWLSNPADAANDPVAMGVNKEALSATLLVNYTGAETELNNYTYSIQNKTFAVSQPDPNTIRVDYAIGKIEKNYMIPSAISVERYKQFTGKMSKKESKQISSVYTLVEPSKLGSMKNKDELLELYPGLADTAMYVIKSDTKETNKAKIEPYFVAAGYTEDEFEIDQQNVAKARDNNGPVFNVSVIYRLEGKDLVVEVPYSEIRCQGDAPITFLSVLPMFGAAGTAEEGYIFIPEGGGALIRYNNGKLSQNNYYANLYGWDYARERKEVVSETKNAFPVFGMEQEDGSFICIIDGGSAFAAVNADIAGRFNSYNFVYGKYHVLHYDKFSVSNRTAQTLYMYEQKIPDATIVQRYRFVEGGSYVKMAEAYRDYLTSKPEMRGEQASEDMPIHVELIGAVNKVVPKAGIPIDSVIPTTTFAESETIIDELVASGVKDLHVRITGWCNGGVRQKVLTGVHVLGELGGESGMKKLISFAKDKNVMLSFDGISCFAYNSGLFDGFSPYSNAARFATREQARIYNYDIVTYQQSDWQESYYLVRPEYAKKNAMNLINGVADRSAAGVAFRDVGSLLSADYYVQNIVSREAVKKQDVETLQTAVDKGLYITVKEGNDYSLPYADMITDMNLHGNAYGIIDRRIPFYQIAIHGMKNYTGEAINLSGDYQTTLLECAEYGAGLNFSFMKEDTTILRDSQYSCYTAAGYDLWKEKAVETALKYQDDMKGLNRLKITGHERLDGDVAVTTYEDGTKVYVNYSMKEYKDGTVTVPAQSYHVEGGNGK